MIERYEVCKQQNQRKLRHLGRLELHPAEPDPAVHLVFGGQRPHDQQQNHRHAHQRHRKLVPVLIVKAGHDQHDHQPGDREFHLLADVKIAVFVIPFIRICVAGGIQTNQSHRQNQQQDDEKRHIKAALGIQQPPPPFPDGRRALHRLRGSRHKRPVLSRRSLPPFSIS